jgi:hypothetical protein
MIFEGDHCLIKAHFTVRIVCRLKIVLQSCYDGVHLLQPRVAFLTSGWLRVIIDEMQVTCNLLKSVSSYPIHNRGVSDGGFH